MHQNLTEKLIASHLVSGEMVPGSEISINIDQTLTHDALGTMAFLEFEAIGVQRVKTKLSVSYVDHLTLQEGFENSDDHKYLMTVADKYGVLFSKPGNGICHQVHLERLTRPGWTLLGSDSHTPTAGAVGVLAMGAGGLDVAVAMAGGPFYLSYPRIQRQPHAHGGCGGHAGDGRRRAGRRRGHGRRALLPVLPADRPGRAARQAATLGDGQGCDP